MGDAQGPGKVAPSLSAEHGSAASTNRQPGPQRYGRDKAIAIADAAGGSNQAESACGAKFAR